MRLSAPIRPAAGSRLPFPSPLRPYRPRGLVRSLRLIGVLAFALSVVSCTGMPSTRGVVIVEYRYIADFRSWIPAPNMVPPPPIIDGDNPDVYSIYEITTISNMDKSTSVTIDLSQVHVGASTSAVLDASSLSPTPQNAILSNLTPPTTSFTIPAGQTLSPHVKIVVRRNLAQTTHLFYTPGSFVLMTDKSTGEPQTIQVLGAENFPERRKNFITITYKHFQTFRIYEGDGEVANIDPDIGVLYKIKTIQVEPEANGKGTFLLSSLRACGNGVAIDPGSLEKPPLYHLVKDAIVNPFLPSSQFTFANVELNWIVMFRCPNVKSTLQSDIDLPLEYLPIGGEVVLLEGQFDKLKWRNDGTLQATDVGSFWGE
jgi:hypothetical protein